MLKVFYYIFKSHTLLKVIRTLKAAIEKCSKEELFVRIYFLATKEFQKIRGLMLGTLSKIELSHGNNLRVPPDKKQLSYKTPLGACFEIIALKINLPMKLNILNQYCISQR